MARKLRTKNDVKSKSSFSWGSKTKSGKEQKSGTVVTFKDGKKATLLTPAGKGTKYASELAMNCKITNDGEFKKKDGKDVELNCCERSYRAGYLDARKDNAKAYNAKKNKK